MYRPNLHFFLVFIAFKSKFYVSILLLICLILGFIHIILVIIILVKGFLSAIKILFTRVGGSFFRILGKLRSLIILYDYSLFYLIL